MNPSHSQIDSMISWLKKHHVAKKLPSDRIKTLAEFLNNLDKVSESGDGWSACCSVHPDSTPSLSISVEQDGRILLCCHRGCEFDDIVREAGMLPTEMFESAPSTRSAILPPRRRNNGVPKLKTADPSWTQKQALFCSHDNRPRVEELANKLSVTTASLESIGIGWCNNEKYWTFPERNGEQKICGIVRRFLNGDKYAFKGGHRGLTLPIGWDQSNQPLHICEGASDVAAAISSDMRAIGRPGLSSGFDDLAILLKDESSEIVVVADNDTEGAGRAGAEKLSERLSNTLKKTIRVMAPPKQYKDLREFLTEKTK